MPKRIPHTTEEMSTEISAQEYAKIHGKNPRQRFGPFLKELERLRIKGRYLEIGSGPGIVAGLIAEENPEVEITGVELSPKMVAVAQEHLEQKGLGDRVRFVPGNANDGELLEKLGTFDLVYSTFSLHHWEEPVRVLRNTLPMIGKNGYLFIFDLKRVWWLYHIPVQNGFFNSIRASYLPREIGTMLKQAGASSVEVKSPFPFFWQEIMARKDV